MRGRTLQGHATPAGSPPRTSPVPVKPLATGVCPGFLTVAKGLRVGEEWRAPAKIINSGCGRSLTSTIVSTRRLPSAGTPPHVVLTGLIIIMTSRPIPQ